MSENPTPKTEAPEVEAPDVRAQMKAARRNITEAAARVLAPDEPRSFRRERELSTRHSDD